MFQRAAPPVTALSIVFEWRLCTSSPPELCAGCSSTDSATCFGMSSRAPGLSGVSLLMRLAAVDAAECWSASDTSSVIMRTWRFLKRRCRTPFGRGGPLRLSQERATSGHACHLYYPCTCCLSAGCPQQDLQKSESESTCRSRYIFYDCHRGQNMPRV